MVNFYDYWNEQLVNTDIFLKFKKELGNDFSCPDIKIKIRFKKIHLCLKDGIPTLILGNKIKISIFSVAVPLITAKQGENFEFRFCYDLGDDEITYFMIMKRESREFDKANKIFDYILLCMNTLKKIIGQ